MVLLNMELFAEAYNSVFALKFSLCINSLIKMTERKLTNVIRHAEKSLLLCGPLQINFMQNDQLQIQK